MLTTNHTDTFIENFSQLEDPRIERQKLYPLIEIVFLVVCAKICGAESFREYVRFGQAKITLLQERLPFVKGIPSKARLSRVFTLINPELLKGCFIGWMKTLYVSVMDDIIPIDGKTLRGSHQSGEGAIHMVSAYSHKTHLVLGQQKVDEKSNEITAIPKLIDLIDIKGSTITIDAMGTQKTIAKKIIDNEADYILALKDNHKNLNEDVQLYLDTEYDKPNQGNLLSHSESDKGHGRIEERTCFVTDKIDWLVDKDEWKGLNAIAMIESKRTLKGRTSIERRYYLTSRDADPEYLNMAIRSHWSIENKLHWVLDVTMGEDGSRVRKDHAPENLAIVRHISLNMLQEAKKSIKDMSIKGFRKMAGWCDKTLGKIIRSKF
jgi:predicted transposase YbfD/YdcC